MAPVRYKSKGVVCETASSSPFNLYTCPVRCFAKVVLLRVTNSDTATNGVIVRWYDSSEDTSYDLLDATVAVGGSHDIIENTYFLMESGDRLDITISTDGDVTVVATVEEIFQPPVA